MHPPATEAHPAPTPNRARPPVGPAGRWQRGSVLVVSLFTVTILSLIFATTMLIATNQQHVVYQIASWQEALHGAESGADLAMAALNGHSWTGWKTLTGTPPKTVPTGGMTSTGAPPTGSYNYLSTTFTHAGEGNTRMTIFTTVDAPAYLNIGGRQWLRVRSVGVTDVPGSLLVSMEKLDTRLRRLSFQTDRLTGATVAKPQATRFVEIIAQPAGTFLGAVATQNSFNMSGGGVVDSFNSSDPTKSTNGLYDVTKRQSHGDVTVMNSASSDLKNTYIYGNLGYGAATVKNTVNVQGSVNPITPFTFPAVSDPSSSWVATNTSVTSINGNTTLTGGTKASPARYKLTSVNVPGGNQVVIQPNVVGQQSYIEVWVTGKFTTSGSGFIIQQPGVHVTYYIDGDINVSGSSFQNLNNQASSCTIYGVTPTSGGSTPTVTISGSGSFIGVINAPAYDFNISGQSNLTGAIIGKTMNISGGASVHFDEALNTNATNTDYAVASWFDDLNN